MARLTNEALYNTTTNTNTKTNNNSTTTAIKIPHYSSSSSQAVVVEASIHQNNNSNNNKQQQQQQEASPPKQQQQQQQQQQQKNNKSSSKGGGIMKKFFKKSEKDEKKDKKELIEISEISVPTEKVPVKPKEEPEELKIKMTTILGESPQDFLDGVLKMNGYSTKRYDTLNSGYYNEPSKLQKASYGVRILEMVEQNDEEGLESCLIAGIHSNPCNEYGESILHLICRQGNMGLLDIMIDQDCNIQCADDFGRTPLHEACRCTNGLCFDVVETLMMKDIHLFYMADAHGDLPLSYVNPEHWYDWMMFLESRVDRYWPPKRRRPGYTQKIEAPELTTLEPCAKPAKDPDHALTTELAWMVASGVIEPEEAVSYMDENVLKKFLPSINQRLNDMAKEEEQKERELRHQPADENDDLTA